MGCLWLKLDTDFNIFDNNLPWFRTDLYNGVINFGCIRYESNQIIFEENHLRDEFNNVHISISSITIVLKHDRFSAMCKKLWWIPDWN